MLQDILIPFIVVGLAELGDKTQLAILCLAAKTKSYLRLLCGVVSAFIIADGFAVIIGGRISEALPMEYVKAGAGLLFIVFGVITLITNNEKGGKCELKQPFISGFSMVLISEIGDKTQVASGLFAAQFNPALVFFGVIASLALLSIIAIYFGKLAYKKLDIRVISAAAGILFIAVGIAGLL